MSFGPDHKLLLLCFIFNKIQFLFSVLHRACPTPVEKKAGSALLAPHFVPFRTICPSLPPSILNYSILVEVEERSGANPSSHWATVPPWRSQQFNTGPDKETDKHSHSNSTNATTQSWNNSHSHSHLVYEEWTINLILNLEENAWGEHANPR